MKHCMVFVEELKKIVTGCVLFPRITENNMFIVELISVDHQAEIVTGLNLQTFTLQLKDTKKCYANLTGEQMICQLNEHMTGLDFNRTKTLIQHNKFFQTMMESTQRYQAEYNAHLERIAQQRRDEESLRIQREAQQRETEARQREENQQLREIVEEQTRRIEQLNAENRQLKSDNDGMSKDHRRKMNDMNDEMDRLRDENDKMRGIDGLAHLQMEQIQRVLDLEEAMDEDDSLGIPPNAPPNYIGLNKKELENLKYNVRNVNRRKILKRDVDNLIEYNYPMVEARAKAFVRKYWWPQD